MCLRKLSRSGAKPAPTWETIWECTIICIAGLHCLIIQIAWLFLQPTPGRNHALVVVLTHEIQALLLLMISHEVLSKSLSSVLNCLLQCGYNCALLSRCLWEWKQKIFQNAFHTQKLQHTLFMEEYGTCCSVHLDEYMAGGAQYLNYSCSLNIFTWQETGTLRFFPLPAGYINWMEGSNICARKLALLQIGATGRVSLTAGEPASPVRKLQIRLQELW